MARRKLIFFTGKDPASDSTRVWTAYHFGLTAHNAGLDAEVRLAADAVKALREDGLPDGDERERVRDKMSEALRAGLFVSG